MDQLRESVFEVIEYHISLDGSIVLDLFAGSGILSWEALSRGAAKAIMVDQSVEICRHLRSVATSLDLNHKVEIIRSDALAALSHLELPAINCLFADPPYAKRDGNRILSVLDEHPVVRDGGLVVIEHGDQEFLLPTSAFTPLWQGARGASIIDVLRCVRANP